MTSLFERVRTRIRQDPRLSRMLHGGLSNFAGRGLAMLVGIVTLPLTVRYLGKVEYGIWVTISTTVMMFSVLDFGIANTLTNFISSAYARDDREAARGYFATAFWLTLGIAVVLGVVFTLLLQSLNMGELLSIKDPALIAQAKMSVAISVGFFLLSLPLNLANRVLAGYQQAHVANYFAMISSLLGLVAIVGTVLLRGSLAGLMLAYCGATLAGGVLLNLWLLFWHKPWLQPALGLVRGHLARSLFGQGSLFFLLQLCGLVVFNTDNLVITHYLGAAEVTPYAVAWKLTSYAALLQSLLIPSFWPAFSEAYHKRDMAWVTRTYHNLERKVLLAVSAAALLMGLLGRPLIRVWVGPAAVPPALLLWTMAGWAILVAATTNQALLLTATSRLRVETTAGVLSAIANLTFSIFLVQRIGAEGVILGTIISFALFMIVPQQLEVRRVLRGDFLPQDLAVESLIAQEFPAEFPTAP